jgi:protoporphyrinogen oxidase
VARHISDITILGAGPAGLSVGHYARARKLPFRIYEKAGQWGGNCVTHEWKGFRYDSGAHRVHGTDKDVVHEIIRLMNGNIDMVRSPSFIHKANGHYIFPLELKNILRNMPVRNLAVGLKDLLLAVCSRNTDTDNFRDLAVGRYGVFFAREFLLDYSEKLWGLPCEYLDTRLAGSRLAGLKPIDLLKGLVKKNGPARHMEGEFYYPRGGIGRLMDSLAESCGPETIQLGKTVTRIFHDMHRIHAIELNNGEQVEVDKVVSTLPMNSFLQLLDPAIAPESLAGCFDFRNLVLVALFLDRERVIDAASIYFPGSDVLFTRAYEPRNRCVTMSPPGKTSLVVEIPCSHADTVWTRPDAEIAQEVIDTFYRLGWFKKNELLGFSVNKMQEAYPVITVESRKSIAEADRILKQIANLKISGRNGRFSYSWIHDQIRWGKTITEELAV